MTEPADDGVAAGADGPPSRPQRGDGDPVFADSGGTARDSGVQGSGVHGSESRGSGAEGAEGAESTGDAGAATSDLDEAAGKADETPVATSGAAGPAAATEPAGVVTATGPTDEATAIAALPPSNVVEDVVGDLEAVGIEPPAGQASDVTLPQSQVSEASAASDEMPSPGVDVPVGVDESWPEWPAAERGSSASDATEIRPGESELNAAALTADGGAEQADASGLPRTRTDDAPAAEPAAPRRWADLVKQFESASPKTTAESTSDGPDISPWRRAPEPPESPETREQAKQAKIEELHETRSPMRTFVSVPDTVRAICPYLQVEGGWRYAVPSRDHRCTAVAPALALTPEKQRRLCLTSDHLTCSTYLAALSARAATDRSTRRGAERQIDGSASGDGSVGRWAFTRTTPVIMDSAGRALSLSGLTGRLGGGQLALAGVLVVAFAGIAVARLQDGRTVATTGLAPSASPSPAVTAAAPPSSSPEVIASPEPSPSPTPSATPSAPPTALPTLVAVRTYTVRTGDTLYGIARKFGTTVKILQQLNGMGSSTVIHVGEVLKLP